LDGKYKPNTLFLARVTCVAVAVLIEIARLVVGVVVVLAGHFFLARRVAVAVLIDIPWLVAWMIVMLARLFLCHMALLQLK